MAEKPARVELRCSNCGRVVATMPEGEEPESELICPGCGATLTPKGPLEKVADKIKDVVEDVTGRDKEKPSS